MNRHKNNKERMSGVLCHPTSFPSPYGIGDFGKGAYDFIDYITDAGQSLWQVLPLGPTGYGDSPYQSFSSFAGQPLLISPELLIKDGLLTDADTRPIPLWHEDKVDYGYVIYYKTRLYEIAFNNFKAMLPGSTSLKNKYEKFLDKHGCWLDDYVTYMASKDMYGGKSWLEWTDLPDITVPDGKKDYYRFLQFEFFSQWSALRDYANSRGIYIIGDIPIFVSLDSADTWANRKFFQLDPKGFPLSVSGVPPDYFSATGQLWGNPLYDWDALKSDNYSWWINRIKHQLDMTDYLRIDHFRGFEAYWSVPYGSPNAIRGEWIKGPGNDFFDALKTALGGDLPIFAEDLGIITPEVEKLRDDYDLPGMKVLQFAFDSTYDSTFLPHHHPKNAICYSGTLDNDTTIGWYGTISREAREKIKLYLNSDCAEINWDLIRAALGSTARYAIIPMQDLLSLDGSCRMNSPGKPDGNWQWRYLGSALRKDIAARLKKYTEIYAR